MMLQGKLVFCQDFTDVLSIFIGINENLHKDLSFLVKLKIGQGDNNN